MDFLAVGNMRTGNHPFQKLCRFMDG